MRVGRITFDNRPQVAAFVGHYCIEWRGDGFWITVSKTGAAVRGPYHDLENAKNDARRWSAFA